MLVLSRKTEESVLLICPGGQKIEVKVNRIDGNQAKLGFAAPPDIIILRQELWGAEHDRIIAQRLEAAPK